MAAGSSRRFGGNKLLTVWAGKPLISYALEVIPAGVKTVVVSQYSEVLALARAHGFAIQWNKRPQDGISYTIRLGLTPLADCDGVLFLVADQPRLRRESIKELLTLWSSQPDRIAGLTANGRRGNPFLFPADLFPELLTLAGDTGGRQVIRRHEERLLLLEVPSEELEDIDFPLPKSPQIKAP